MILHTGRRTDIPAFYAPWFLRRLEEGYVLVRSPYAATTVTRYSLSPEVVDLIGFCSKNPRPGYGAPCAAQGAGDGGLPHPVAGPGARSGGLAL